MERSCFDYIVFTLFSPFFCYFFGFILISVGVDDAENDFGRKNSRIVIVDLKCGAINMKIHYDAAYMQRKHGDNIQMTPRLTVYCVFLQLKMVSLLIWCAIKALNDAFADAAFAVVIVPNLTSSFDLLLLLLLCSYS